MNLNKLIALLPEEKDIHLKALGKSSSASECGELTVLPLGFVPDLIKSEMVLALPLILAEYRKELVEPLEVVVCSAVMASDGTIFRGHRHHHAIRACVDEGKKLFDGIEQQGFVTSRNRYVGREEARKLQDLAKIPSVDKDGYRGNTLFSEDLYGDNKDVIINLINKEDELEKS